MYPLLLYEGDSQDIPDGTTALFPFPLLSFRWETVFAVCTMLAPSEVSNRNTSQVVFTGRYLIARAHVYVHVYTAQYIFVVITVTS